MGERHEDPHKNGNTEDDGSRFFDVLPYAIPCMDSNATHRGQPIGGQFHDKWRGRSSNNSGSKKLRHHQHEKPGGHDHRKHGNGRVRWEKSRNEHYIGRGLSAANHKRRGKDGGQPLARAPEGTRGHHARNRTSARKAPRNNQGHDGCPMQTEYFEDPVQHIGHPRHVPQVFQKDQHGKHDQDQRCEAENRADPVDNAGNNQRLHHAFRNKPCAQISKKAEPVLHPALGIGPEVEGDVKKRKHGAQHD